MRVNGMFNIFQIVIIPSLNWWENVRITTFKYFKKKKMLKHLASTNDHIDKINIAVKTN